jgi:hypothetical protein
MIPLFVALLANFSFAAAPTCDCRQSRDALRDAIGDIIATPQSELCQPLKVGERRNFRLTGAKSPTTVEHKYALERVSDKEYRVHFNVRFVGNDDEDINSSRNKAYTYAWRNMANECLAKVGDKMKGPGGEVLKLVADPEGEKAYVAHVNVDLQDAGKRAHSHGWTKNMDCATVVHELLHLTGLVDEYHETLSGLVKDPVTGQTVYKDQVDSNHAFDCRKVGDGTSIMDDQHARWDQAFGRFKQIDDMCECTDDKTCARFYADKKKEYDVYIAAHPDMKDKLMGGVPGETPKTCPAGFKANPDYRSESYMAEKPVPSPYWTGKTKKEIPQDKMYGLIHVQNVEAVNPGENPSLIDERQWNAIVFPGCFAKNWAYYTDAQNAYRTSVEHGGQGCVDTSWAKAK